MTVKFVAQVRKGVLSPDGFFSNEMNSFVEQCEAAVIHQFIQIHFESKSDYSRYLLTFTDPLPLDFFQFGFPVSFVPFGVT
jgi:hypothetical protein